MSRKQMKERYLDNLIFEIEKIKLKEFMDNGKNTDRTYLIFGETCSELIKLGEYKKLTEYTKYRISNRFLNGLEIFICPLSYDIYFNAIVKHEKIPEDILTKYFGELQKPLNELNENFEFDFSWVNESINKYNYSFKFSNIAQLAKLGYTTEDEMQNFNIIFTDKGTYKKYFDDFEEFKKLIIKYDAINNITQIMEDILHVSADSAYNFIESLRKVHDITDKIEEIFGVIIYCLRGNYGFKYKSYIFDKIIDILLEYAPSDVFYEKILYELLMGFKNHDHGQHYLSARLFFEQKSTITLKNINIINILDNIIDYWTNNKYFESITIRHTSGKLCSIDFDKFLLNYMYEHIKTTNNISHENFICGCGTNKELDDLNNLCNENICIYSEKYLVHKKYENDIRNRRSILVNKIKLQVSQKDKLYVIKRGYAEMLDIKDIENFNIDVILKYLCIHQNYEALKHLLSQKKFIPNLTHLMYILTGTTIHSDIIKLLVDYSLQIDKNFIDLLYNGGYNFPNNTVFENLLRLKAKEYNYIVPRYNCMINNSKTTTKNISCKSLLQPYNKFLESSLKLDPKTKTGKKNIEKITPHFYASMYNPNILIFEHLVDEFNYTPTFMDIIEIPDNKRKYLLLKRFGYLKD